MTLKEVDSLFATPERIKAIEKALGTRSARTPRRVTLAGLPGSAPAMLLAGISRKKGASPMLIVADDAEAAGYLYNDLKQLSSSEMVAFFPSGFKRDIRYGQPDSAARILRTETLDSWTRSNKLAWVVSYPEALAEKVPAPAALQDDTLSIAKGGRMRMTDVVSKLLDLGFSQVDYVYEPGQFARRGSILDVFSFSYEYPYRIDFFDDEIDTLRVFDVETQLSRNDVDSIAIIPASGAEAQDEGVSFIEFAGKDAIVACRNADEIISRVREIANSEFSESAIIADEGDPEAMKKLVDADAFAATFTNRRILEFSASPNPSTESHADVAMAYQCSLQTLYHKNFDLIADSFRDFESRGYTIYILSDSRYQCERLKTIFADRGDKIEFTPVERTIHEGFCDNELKLCFFTDHQIFDRFHKYSLRSDKARSGKIALSLKELSQIEPGDFIVHIDHGIGRFGGLVKTSVNGRPQEMIKLFYQNDDIILVSIHALHKLSKYRGKEGVPPKINKLGTGAWNRLKERTKTKLKDIARDLIRLYAARKEEKGFAFSPDSYLQQELEASFIYEDTPDQLKATEAIKKDMESDRPMDRLICGDVGFGKTELAIRASLKAAADSKQTAVLVPTTVLAMQHYHTFSRRLKDFPVRVEFLSRAKKPKETRKILEDLEAGKIDIIIGTHKLIGKSVKFHDLGLLVVDEEQKFGVAVKEKLKQLKVNVDTLTMSATPIPRTLQFSLMGARDLSSLNTPPANRHPVMTTVCGFDDGIVADAVNFELSRNGQVFYISNRIENLYQLADRLKNTVPGVRVAVAHGQMPPEDLEKIILDFTAHDYDVLLSTTIVENGIDMPNVNTIIVNNAQNFGLSELHQLRGRVGRSSRKAFCYLLVPSGKALTPVARRRLQAIESFSDLGSGIHIAMQDLDIRGAGNLLGAEQSGFIVDLGYEAYQKILKESVLELKNEEFAEEFADIANVGEEEFVADCTIESDLELRLPPSYVPQESERISLYQQLDNMTDEEQTKAFRNELRDRFGAIPEVTEELIKIVPLRIIARRLGIERLTLKDNKMYLYFVGDDNKAYYMSPAFGKVLSYVQGNPRRTRLRDVNGKRSILLSDVESVTAALGILRSIRASTPV
ncbi:MAG: transcription-repair coupling factor [Clostridium sp.]|nr:transcription-repair coupling factor [Prevotella sp.]MCM1429744.1 transcription-repair coupling factor [Clostridium sp.]MCM1476217.1 transcription-repair coupling factor [Muribaculaceae bacterium]